MDLILEQFDEATKIVQKYLKEFPILYEGYQKNLAQAFYDKCMGEKPHLNPEEVHEISNVAAKSFLDLFIKE